MVRDVPIVLSLKICAERLWLKRNLKLRLKKAIELRCNLDQVKEAIELGKMIKQRPINDIYAQAE